MPSRHRPPYAFGLAALLAAGAAALAACKAAVRPDDAHLAAAAESAAPELAAPYPGPADGPAAAAAAAERVQLCGDGATPRYDEPDVRRAAAALGRMSEHSLAPEPWLRDLLPAAAPPAGVGVAAHEILAQLCSALSDRPGLLRERLRLIGDVVVLAPAAAPAAAAEGGADAGSEPSYLRGRARGAGAPRNAPSSTASVAAAGARELLARLTVETYGPFLLAARAHDLARARAGRAAPASLCEAKLLVHQAAPDARYAGLEAFDRALAAFAPAHCAARDHERVLLYAGAPALGPHALEATAAAWHAASVALQCAGPTRRAESPRQAGQRLLLTDDDCRAYFERPFAARWAAARAGLGAWLLREPPLADAAAVARTPLYVMPDWTVGADRRPHRAFLSDALVPLATGWTSRWEVSTLGIEGGTAPLLREAVDRHAEAALAGYDDGMRQGRMRERGYSPFTGASFDPLSADAAAAPCYLEPCAGEVPARYWKHFLYVMEVPLARLHAPAAAPDLDRDWLDAAALGTGRAARSRRTALKLGAPLEGEAAALLYLHALCADGSPEAPGRRCDQ